MVLWGAPKVCLNGFIAVSGGFRVVSSVSLRHLFFV